MTGVTRDTIKFEAATAIMLDTNAVLKAHNGLLS